MYAQNVLSHSFNKYFIKHFYIMGTVFNATHIAMNKTKPLPLWNLYFNGRRQIVNKKICQMMVSAMEGGKAR